MRMGLSVLLLHLSEVVALRGIVSSSHKVLWSLRCTDGSQHIWMAFLPRYRHGGVELRQSPYTMPEFPRFRELPLLGNMLGAALGSKHNLEVSSSSPPGPPCLPQLY